jgi:hypothetical protein
MNKQVQIEDQDPIEQQVQCSRVEGREIRSGSGSGCGVERGKVKVRSGKVAENSTAALFDEPDLKGSTQAAQVRFAGGFEREKKEKRTSGPPSERMVGARYVAPVCRRPRTSTLPATSFFNLNPNRRERTDRIARFECA